MSSAGSDWRPSASLQMLRRRAALLARTREFFAARGVLEVDTPLIVNSPASALHIHSATVHLTPLGAPPAMHAAPAAAPAADTAPPLFLHTSPEYAMKRLLAAGSGDIYQICHVARGFEQGRQHNPEFTLVEWYRIGFSLEELMSEVEALLRALLAESAAPWDSERLSYREAFRRELGLDPRAAGRAQLVAAAQRAGYHAPPPPAAAGDGRGVPDDRDELLELLMGASVGPRLGRGGFTFVHSYPASQAALARLDPADPRSARRFELYCAGMELANGFHELASSSEQRARFDRDNDQRRRRGLPAAPPDERLLAALAAGLPDCAGVALGFERVLMLAAGARHIDEVLAFPTARA
jgi:elongation factor P--(R)-beta-lysine ligase